MKKTVELIFSAYVCIFTASAHAFELKDGKFFNVFRTPERGEVIKNPEPYKIFIGNKYEEKDEDLRRRMADFDEINNELPDTKRLKVASLSDDALVEKATGLRVGFGVRVLPVNKRGENQNRWIEVFEFPNKKKYAAIAYRPELTSCPNPLLKVNVVDKKFIFYQMKCQADDAAPMRYSYYVLHRKSNSVHSLPGYGWKEFPAKFSCKGDYCKFTPPVNFKEKSKSVKNNISDQTNDDYDDYGDYSFKYRNDGFDCAGDLIDDSSCPAAEKLELLRQ